MYTLQGIYVDMNMIDNISSITGKLENRKGKRRREGVKLKVGGREIEELKKFTFSFPFFKIVDLKNELF